MRRWLLLAVLLVVALSSGGGGHGARAAGTTSPYIIETDMYGTEVVPAIDTPAWGFVRFFYNADRSEADYTVDVKGLSSNIVTGADMHLGIKGVNGPIVHHLADGDFLTIGGHIRFSKTDLLDMEAGLYYVSLTSDLHPDGEMRGQIILPADFLSPDAQSLIGPFPPGSATPGAPSLATTPTSQIITGAPTLPTLTPVVSALPTSLPTPPSDEASEPPTPVIAPPPAVPTPAFVPPPPVPQPQPAILVTGAIHPPNTGDGGLLGKR